MSLFRKALAAVGATFVSMLVLVPSAFAQEAVAAGDNKFTVQVFVALAAGFGIAIAAFGGAMAQGKAVTAAMEGIARNPGAQGKMFVPMILGLALIESLVIYSLVISFSLIGKL
ncbi:MAG TPA: F0F1 ATP synthase subunit C [Myxococcota bacterium]|nr:F0F1 ATP synthase subunit C [Myxococcota bacterium]HOA12802.1 F0F1 ATP synthase subunit C [Myxococcota bacterium]HOC99165.1 F0F1 ATP synthase subunit C [Myxococcota bacterium]HOH76506.1 F0F1 ATP synthase subunit C [Myxococcota bacterium]HPV05176.1 F0F1 ATP synthase subunit C [Myxococcota bacterium]